MLRGQPPDQPFMAFYLREGRLRAALAVNQTHELASLKRLIATGATPDLAALADASTPLKGLLPRPA